MAPPPGLDPRFLDDAAELQRMADAAFADAQRPWRGKATQPKLLLAWLRVLATPAMRGAALQPAAKAARQVARQWSVPDSVLAAVCAEIADDARIVRLCVPHGLALLDAISSFFGASHAAHAMAVCVHTSQGGRHPHSHAFCFVVLVVVVVLCCVVLLYPVISLFPPIQRALRDAPNLRRSSRSVAIYSTSGYSRRRRCGGHSAERTCWVSP